MVLVLFLHLRFHHCLSILSAIGKVKKYDVLEGKNLRQPFYTPIIVVLCCDGGGRVLMLVDYKYKVLYLVLYRCSSSTEYESVFHSIHTSTRTVPGTLYRCTVVERATTSTFALFVV